ncbi:MAG: S46 family peptidase [Bacteroidales bacterium]|nr:S46 family peptidase [Bacteroidales bacterium]
MRNIVFGVCSLVVFSLNTLKADEGMWMLNLIEQLNMSDMREMGLQLTTEDIYSINNSSLKDAIVIFGDGCTAEVVSNNGLLFTNHHCGFDEIQNHSSVEHDYMTDGFWAKSRDEEIPNPDLEVRFLIRIENVTEKINLELSEEMAEVDRQGKISELIDEIETEASEDERYEAEVNKFYAGNEFYLFVYEVFKDVRLVGAPPSSIGKFGYDTDNWEWPRQTGDFSIFRIYTAPDGSPAEYSVNNIPLKPKYYLPISIDGYSEGDFTFVMGYPGSTNRYLCSFGVEETMLVTNKILMDVRGIRREILDKDMMADDEIRIKYAAKFSRSNNYWKYAIGQNRGILRLKVIEKKQSEEKKFREWVESDSAQKEIYGDILGEMENIYLGQRNSKFNYLYIKEAFFRASELFDLISEFQYLNLLLDEGEDQEEIKEEVELLTDFIDGFYPEYNVSTDKKVVAAMLKLYRENIPPGQLPDFYFTVIDNKFKGDIDKFAEILFSKTMFVDEKSVREFLLNPSKRAMDKDIGFKVTKSIYKRYYNEVYTIDAFSSELKKYERLYLKGLQEMYADKNIYPDANFTMRLTYGIVDDYSPGDAVHYDYFTTLKGVMEKEDPTNYEFEVDMKLKDLFERKDYGEYGDSIMVVNFITNNDITGGNSGSPVLNAEGELIGLAFDGNWEAMSSDIIYEPDLQRCICVDIRYVLFVIDKFAGADYLIDELSIIN